MDWKHATKGPGGRAFFFFLFWKDNVTANFSISNFQVDFFCLVKITEKKVSTPSPILSQNSERAEMEMTSCWAPNFDTGYQQIRTTLSIAYGTLRTQLFEYYSSHWWICRMITLVPATLIHTWIFLGAGHFILNRKHLQIKTRKLCSTYPYVYSKLVLYCFALTRPR